MPLTPAQAGAAARATAMAGMRGAMRFLLPPPLQIAGMVYDAWTGAQSSLGTRPNLSGWTRTNCGSTLAENYFVGEINGCYPAVDVWINNTRTYTTPGKSGNTYGISSYHLYPGRYNGPDTTTQRGQFVSIYRLTSATPPVIGTYQALTPNTSPHIPSWAPGRIDPLLNPPLAPAPDPNSHPPYNPRTNPSPSPNPHRSPSERTDRGNDLNPRQRPNPRQQPNPRVDPWLDPTVNPNSPTVTNPSHNPNTGSTPATSVVITPGKNPQISNQPHIRQPPKKGDKEGKIGMGGLGRAASNIFHGITEVMDAIDSVYGALPSDKRLKYRPGKPLTPQDKLGQILSNWDSIDLIQAGINLRMNAVEDSVIGALNRKAGKTKRLTGGLPVGQFYGV